jgi:hydrogenase maturation protease
MRRTLIIGYGNPSRRDDGVALAIVNGLRGLQGRPLLDEDMDGLEELGAEIDTIFLQQLTPELAEIIARYDEVIFVDAHLGQYPELLREVALEPTAYAPTLVSHHLRPEALLALTQALWGQAPRARLLSVRGYDFDFGTELSPMTEEGSKRAIARIWQALNG